MGKTLDKKMLSMMTLQERFKYINKKKEHEFNKTIHRGRDGKGE
jgi:hypothetical protein